jgi:hypothetical protein
LPYAGIPIINRAVSVFAHASVIADGAKDEPARTAAIDGNQRCFAVADRAVIGVWDFGGGHLLLRLKYQVARATVAMALLNPAK